MEKIFITGMSRSGTTLMDRWLNTLPGTRIFSQPLPYLFRLAKAKFYESIDHNCGKYIFSQFFGADWYDIDQLERFLGNWNVSPDEARICLEDMKGWSGQQSELLDVDSLVPDRPVKFGRAVFRMLEVLAENDDTERLGLKEILCEEFVPYFAASGWKIVLVLRNPLDVLTSIQFGSGSRFTGERRPTLFHLRSWRRSAQMAALMASSPNVCVVRFEDVVRDSEHALRRVVRFIDLDWRDEFLRGEMKDEKGEVWTPNSSFENASSQSTMFDLTTVDRYRELMPSEMQEYVRAACGPEMRRFGYLDQESNIDCMDKFSEPFEIECDDFTQDFSRKDQISLEKDRYRLLMNGTGPETGRLTQLLLSEKLVESLPVDSRT